MDTNERNEYGCPLLNQTGATAIRNFGSVIASLSPELRAAFERERAARVAEAESWGELRERGAGAKWGMLALNDAP
jgi:hypothetical protein